MLLRLKLYPKNLYFIKRAQLYGIYYRRDKVFPHNFTIGAKSFLLLLFHDLHMFKLMSRLASFFMAGVKSMVGGHSRKG